LIVGAAVFGLAGCGGGAAGPGPSHGDRQRPVPSAPAPVVTASCKQPRGLAQAPAPQETGVYRAGPLLLVTGEDLAQLPGGQARHGFGSDAIAVVNGRRPVLLSVDRAAPVDVSLRFGGRPVAPGGAIRFPACGDRPHRFGGGFDLAGEGCARFHVSVAGARAQPLLIPVGNSLWGCPRKPAAEPLAPEIDPYLGVACRVANSIACDRVGVGVTFAAPAALVTVEVDGRLVTLNPPDGTSGGLWLGYLYNAGLRHGPLAAGISPTDGFWSGTPEVHLYATVTVFLADGTVASRTSRVLLHPGFG
jgi:hypothetical protein